MSKKAIGLIAFTLGFLVFNSAHAQIKVGVTVSATGPAASLGIPERNAITLAPKTIAGKSVEYIVLDDASDPTTARRNVERFTSENKVDVVIGSSTSPASLAMVEVAGRSKTPMISLGASRSIIYPMDDNKLWSFKTPYNDATSAAALVKNMKALGVKSVGTMAFNDAYGEGWVKEFTPLADKNGIKIAANELYARNDTSVVAQTLKIMAANPDAVLIVASGTPGALPQTTLFERGYKGKIYQTTGVVNNDFIRVGGKSVEGTLIAGDPVSVATQLPDGHPAKEAGMKLVSLYDGAFGKGSSSAFDGYAWDAILLLEAAVPRALKAGEPGTEQFRAGLRDALEGSNGVATTAGPVTMGPEDHNGYDADAPLMITIKDGAFAVAH
jgi:branched-chain amino acid transport system substrate-binding protein